MRRFIVAGTGNRTGDLSAIALGIEWIRGGPCALYWPRTGVSSHYPTVSEVRKNIESDNLKVLWTDQGHLPTSDIISITELL